MSNAFTNEELHQMVFDSACRAWKETVRYIQSHNDGSGEYLKTQTRTFFDRIYAVQQMLGYSIPDDGKGEDSIRMKRLQKKVEYMNEVLTLRMYPNGREMWVMQDDSRRKWESQRDEAVREIAKIDEKIKRAEAEKAKARIAAYWEAHAEEKKALEQERKQLKKDIRELDGPIESAQNKAEKLRQGKKEALPIEMECEKQKQLIRELEQERSQCGIFKGKKKKAITERLNVTERPRLEELEKNAADQRKANDNRIEAEIAELLKSIEPQCQERDRLKKREKEILDELTRPR